MIDFWEHRKRQIVEEYRIAWKQRTSAPIMNNVVKRWEELADKQVYMEKANDNTNKLYTGTERSVAVEEVLS